MVAREKGEARAGRASPTASAAASQLAHRAAVAAPPDQPDEADSLPLIEVDTEEQPARAGAADDDVKRAELISHYRSFPALKVASISPAPATTASSDTMKMSIALCQLGGKIIASRDFSSGRIPA